MLGPQLVTIFGEAYKVCVRTLCSGLTTPILDPAPQKAGQGSAPPQELLKTTPIGYLRPRCQPCPVIPLLPF